MRQERQTSFLKTVEAAERFITGFEDDPDQEGIPALLKNLREIISAETKSKSVPEKSADIYKPTCSECGSDDILNDAYAEWDNDGQSWILQQVFDKGAICQDCGGETSLDWVPPTHPRLRSS